MDVGLRATLAVIVPSAAAMVVLARPLLELLGTMIGHPGATGTTAVALAMLSLGLPGFCVFLYVVRVLQSTQDLRSAFWLYALENGSNIVLALALFRPLGVRGIMLSISVAYSVAAVAGLWHVRRHLGGLDRHRLWRPLGRVALATAALAAGTVLGSSVTGSETALALVERLLLGLAGGAALLVLAAAAMTAWSDRAGRHSPPPAPAPMPPAGRPPLRPRLGPVRRPGDDDDDDRGRLA